jgi:hypothetical protein
MHDLIDQLESSLASKNYLISLYAALTIPDIAGAMSSENGEASGAKYISWYEQWVRPLSAVLFVAQFPEDQRQYAIQGLPASNPLTGEACYRFRCSLLHQGSTQHSKSPFSRIIFIEPENSTSLTHNLVIQDALCIDLRTFCREIIVGTRLWLRKAESDPHFLKNQMRSAKRHPNGLPPYLFNTPVIG